MCRMDLFAQAEAQGIQTEFLDGQGHRRVTDAAALKIIREAWPPKARGPRVGHPVVVRSGRPSRTELPATARLPVEWKIVADSGVIAKGESSDHAIDWPRGLPPGVYRLQVSNATTAEDVPLISAPERAFGGEFDRCWLLAVQLYGVRSARNWGMGDFTDLASLIELAHHLGADGVGLNPLHVLFDDRPGDCSPYSPNSRLFLNALYVDPGKIPEFRLKAATRDALAQARAGDVVDYVAVAALKWRALRSAFDAFRRDATQGRRREFEKFRAERAPLLSRFACFEMLRHKFNKPWWDWPKQWRQPDDIKLAKLRDGPYAAEIEFAEFVQWTADRQLQACPGLATPLGIDV